MPSRHRSVFRTATLAAVVSVLAHSAFAADKKYDPGASDTEIKLGQTIPYSGAGSLYGVIGRTQAAYFQMLNELGGINGRKINFMSLDDAYSAPKAVEATRRLAEQDEVLALFGSLGTAPQSAVQKFPTARRSRSCCSTPAPRAGITRKSSSGPRRACRSIRPRAGSSRAT
jgi:ABC-type branched-subunit amino acid transport system substrate-binding protein